MEKIIIIDYISITELKATGQSTVEHVNHYTFIFLL